MWLQFSSYWASKIGVAICICLFRTFLFHLRQTPIPPHWPVFRVAPLEQEDGAHRAFISSPRQNREPEDWRDTIQPSWKLVAGHRCPAGHRAHSHREQPGTDTGWTVVTTYTAWSDKLPSTLLMWNLPLIASSSSHAFFLPSPLWSLPFLPFTLPLYTPQKC